VSINNPGEDIPMNSKEHITSAALSAITRRSVLAGLGALSTAGGAGVTWAQHRRGGAAPLRPDVRIEAAIAEIEAALQEKFPGWRVQVRNDLQHVQHYASGSFVEGDPCCQAILIYTSNENFGAKEARWFTVYTDEKLLAADAGRG
jgi:hypothetical protein